MSHAIRHFNPFPVTITTGLCLAVLMIIQGPSAIQMADYTHIVFPADHALNMPVDSLPLHANSDNFITSMGKTTALHPDFGTSWSDGGTNWQMGMPYNVVGAAQPAVPINFTEYADDSDPGPWPVPVNPLIETVPDWQMTDEGDRHLLIVDSNSNTLYEAWNFAGKAATGSPWEAANGAKFDLNGYKLRPADWTSADAAGLPIFPLLIRYDEVDRALKTDGVVHHAVRFTAAATQKAYLWPARHQASSSTDKNRPPMGLRVRLKAAFNISGYSPRMQVILRTMKKYGLIMADNGSNWYFQGTHDERWDDDDISTLKAVRGGDFEVVDISNWTGRPGFDPNSGKVPSAAGTRISRPAVGGHSFTITASGTTRAGRVSILLQMPEPGPLAVTLFDVSGRNVARIFDGWLAAGHHTFGWSAAQGLPAGIYFIGAARPDGRVITGKVTLVR